MPIRQRAIYAPCSKAREKDVKEGRAHKHGENPCWYRNGKGFTDDRRRRREVVFILYESL